MSNAEHAIIAVEEHYWDPELSAYFAGAEGKRADEIERRLHDFEGDRIKDMDRANIQMQVLSHGAPSAQKLAADIAVPLVQRVNDRLATAVASRPDRFAAFAALPTALPEAAADELQRCVELGFKGAMLHGLSNGEFLDLKKFWPIYARAEALDVPIYLHPSHPHPAVSEAYYKDYAVDFPMIARPAWGYTVEAGTQAVRLVLSGVFERHPRLKIILGHLGESLPFQLWRIDQALSRPGQKSISFRDIFCNNFWVTTSGFFSTPALDCCIAELGTDRILFAVDWPFVPESLPAVAWMTSSRLSVPDKSKILGGNARALLKL
ncbi:amidohydrolase [Pseudolabrys taiwanensis]|uniref:Amidohydrolase n=1 Tax=Pseudolabrys taiwanensis TaxID=331696 RepID=A0A345ZWW3_9HYPH|nr:amidohydrolase family protein [Pseudolabrys taiwanensis]AXK81410.1 amidohydrolase [Pseudolabrys taiwanensis]